MISSEWPAEDYAIGSYIQSTVSDQYFNQFPIHPDDDVLDIGCGDGAYSLKLIKHYPMASFLGIDGSQNMLNLAASRVSNSQVKWEKMDALDLHFKEQFDFICSFWCLQWVSPIKGCFESIYQALRKNGRFRAIFPTGDDAFMTSFAAVKNSERFPILKQFKAPIDYSQFEDLEKKLATIPFKKLSVRRDKQKILLPSLETFRKFIFGISFYQGQIPEPIIKELNEAMVQAYKEDCEKKFDGQYYFEFHNFYVEAEK